MMKIGVLSDTHDNLLPAVVEQLNGVDLIIHAGDIGKDDLLTRLGEIAPVTAVRGNMDGHPSFQSLPAYRVVEVEGSKILVTHRVGRPEQPHQAIRETLFQVRPHVVVFGHTHNPCNQRVNGILFFNPGTAGKRQFGASLTFGFLEIDSHRIVGTIVDLGA